jgi:SAM-dependent methyltransferase
VEKLNVRRSVILFFNTILGGITMLLRKNLRVLGLSSLVMTFGLVQALAFQLGSRSATDWIEILEREERVAGLKTDEVVSRLKLEPGDTVADIGAGTGVFSRPLARAVSPTGTLFAVEVDQELLVHISEQAKREDIENIQTVLGEFEDPNLPTREVDLAFFHDVLHHIENRQAYLKTLASYLKPEGRIVVIERIGGHGEQPEMQITLGNVKQWMAAAGFQLAEEFDVYDNKFFAVFGRD